MVTYAAVKNQGEEEKKKKKKKTESSVTQQVTPQAGNDAPMYAVINKSKKAEKKKLAKTEEVSPQTSNDAPMYAVINKPKKAAEKKKSDKTEQVSSQAEDHSVMHTIINKPNKTPQKDNTMTKEIQQVYKDSQMLCESKNNRFIRLKRHSFTQDRRRVMWLVCVLIGMCLILLFTVVFLGATCTMHQNLVSGSKSPNGSSGCSLLCPDLWIRINDKCYFLSEEKKPRVDSDKNCTEGGGRLATVKEKTIQRLVTITGKEFWVGLSQYNTHAGLWTGKWADGSMETITEGTGSCAKLGSRLILENCYMELHWICERDPV